MGYILMQTGDSPQSLIAVKLLEDTDNCAFDLSLDGTQLRPVFFKSRSNQSFEENYYSFVDDVACGR